MLESVVIQEPPEGDLGSPDSSNIEEYQSDDEPMTAIFSDSPELWCSKY